MSSDVPSVLLSVAPIAYAHTVNQCTAFVSVNFRSSARAVSGVRISLKSLKRELLLFVFIVGVAVPVCRKEFTG
jgi:hypothetical protein